MAKRYCPIAGFVCPSCHEFSLYAEKVLKRHGIQHVTLHPKRHSSIPKTHTQDEK
jgi:hypothetical protein